MQIDWMKVVWAKRAAESRAVITNRFLKLDQSEGVATNQSLSLYLCVCVSQIFAEASDCSVCFLLP